jgi:hypothetical protein
MTSPFAARLGLALAGAVVVGGPVVGCGGTPNHGIDARRAGGAPLAALHPANLRGPDDPTVHGARIVPANLDEARTWGVEAGGGVRAVVAGLRLVASPGGAVVAAAERLPASPSVVVELPQRLGGGFAMALGTHLWRSPTWLGIATPSVTLSGTITDVIVGLDRVYLRAGQGPLVALDPRTGANLDLGPLPPSPRVVSIAALDAWRAVVVADLRGTLVTLDAGSSWRAVRLPIEASRAVALTDAFAVGGFDATRTMQWWEVLPDGQAGALASSPASPTGTAAERALLTSALTSPLTAMFTSADGASAGATLLDHALQAAVEDGWPLTDGTALVARDGSLVRVRLADGAVVEAVTDAFSLTPARCHPLSLARADDRGAFGFVCGEAHGRTAVFRWDPTGSRLVELRRFDAPREVLASGNGALAVRGPCAPQAVAVGLGEGTFCVMTPDGAWSELHVSGAPGTSGAGAGAVRLVALSNARVALIRPPEAGDLSTARLTLTRGLTDDVASTDVPLQIPESPPDVTRALRFGVWMDGFEERRPGVLGGWIDVAGSVLGLEIALDGEVRVGESIRDAGAPIASGRWAFGWTPSGGGFETTDGGMIWTKEIALPAPIAEPRAGRDRSCGPVGCVLAGWLRVGWGVVEGPPLLDPPPARPRAVRRAPNLTMDCAPVGPRVLSEGLARAAATPARASSVPRLAPRGLGFGASSGATSGVVTAFRPFVGRAGAAVPAGDLGLSVDASHVLDRGSRSRPVARVYTWGPSAGDWDASGRWQVLWSPPWPSPAGPGPDTRSSAVAPAPWPSLEVAVRVLGNGLGLPPEWTVVPGEDADHALLVERRVTLGGAAGPGGLLMLATLDSDRAPVDVRRPGGEPWPDLQGAVRAGGRWYIATSQGGGEPAATVVWLLDGASAHEVGRVPRVAAELSGPGRLARRAGGVGASDTVGLVTTGPDADGAERGSSLWVSSLDPEAKAFAEPELLAPADLSDRAVPPCTGDDTGWEIEASFPGTIDIRVGGAWRSRLQAGLARLRIWRAGACVDDVFGSADAQAARSEEAIWTASAGGTAAARWGPGIRTVAATVVTDQARARLRCRVSP